MGKILPLFAAAFVAVSAPAMADADVDMRPDASSDRELPPYLQCVPYAREVSGIEIFGDAHTWWDQAEGRYKRGHKPKVGAVMAFRPYGNMTLGHVAAVSKVIDKRTVLLRHANWSPIGGRRGQIENDVKAIDISPENDWSEVRVWYAPLQNLGTTAWPVEGFIYGDRPQDRNFQPTARIAAETPLRAPTKAKAREDVVAAIIAANS
jgi:surface antigen